MHVTMGSKNFTSMKGVGSTTPNPKPWSTAGDVIYRIGGLTGGELPSQIRENECTHNSK